MTASDPVQLAVDATHLQQVARHIQAQVDSRIRAVEQASSGLRQVTVASRNTTDLSCTVYLDGDTDVTLPCRPVGTHVVPIVGLDGWAIQNGTDLVLVGMRGNPLPKAKLRSTSTATVTTEVDWDFAAGAVRYDTEWDGTTGLYNAAGGNLVVRWPGVYAFGARGQVTPSADNIQPVVLLQELGGGAYYDAWQDTSRGTNNLHFTMANERFFTVGQGLQLRVRSAGGSSTFGDTDPTNELGMALWMSYKP